MRRGLFGLIALAPVAILVIMFCITLTDLPSRAAGTQTGSVTLPTDGTVTITITGTIPPRKPPKPIVLIQADPMSGPGGPRTFKFSAPLSPSPVHYALTFCVGPAANPCGLPTSQTVNVPAGQQKVEVINTDLFKNNVLVVGQGTKVPVAFAVTIE